jgi:2'-5' RNA ligase
VGSALKWVDPEGIHLTLKFLGYVEEGAVLSLSAAVEAAVAGMRAPHLRLAGLGAFPNPRQPRVLWAGLAGEVERVRELQKRVEDTFSPLGFAAEGRAFSPHLTLARVRDTASPGERRAVADLAAGGVGAPELAFTAATVHLMKSELRPTGARYESLHAVALLP